MDIIPISRYDMCKIPPIGYDGTKMGIENFKILNYTTNKDETGFMV
jgi:hypothetical protein